MKLTSLFSLIGMMVCSALRYPLYYNVGYGKQSYGSLDLCWLVGAFFFWVLVITWIISLVRRRHRWWTGGMMIGLLVLMVLIRITPDPSKGVVYGLRDRLTLNNDIDELRKFARDFDKLPRLSDNFRGDTKEYMREDLTKIGLDEKYPLLRCMNVSGFDGPSAVYEDDGVIEVRWGAALEGHWGFSVGIDGRKLDPDSEPGGLRVSDDILAVSELN